MTNLRIINRGVFSAPTFDKVTQANPDKSISLKSDLIFATVLQPEVQTSLATSASEYVSLKSPSQLIRAEDIRFINPVMASRVSAIVTPTVGGTEGVPKEKLTVPISPSADVTDELFFENPKDQAKKLYLPRYRVSVQNISGISQYKISLGAEENNWKLIIYLDKYSSPKIEAERHSASELAHQVAVLLKYHINGSRGIIKELSFQEVTLEESGIKAVMNFDSLAERDEVYRAITENNYQSVLIVRRVFRVAIPLDMSDSGSLGQDLQPPRVPPLRVDPTREPPRIPPKRMVPIDQDIANLVVDFDPISRPHLRNMTSSTDTIKGNADAKHRLINRDVFAVVTNADTSSAHDTVTPLFREVTRSIDIVPEPHPFSFPSNLHPYIFRDITPLTNGRSGLVRIQVDSFSYYQDVARPYVFYYLPDSFKIARKPEVPHSPIMSVKFESVNSVKLAYLAMPYTDTVRLSNALDKLKHNPSFLSAQLPKGIDSPVLQPLQIDPNNIKFYLGIPGQDGSSGPFQDRSKNVLLDIITGITDEMAFNLEDFQTIFNSIFEGVTLIFQGKVEVEVYKDNIETIPFIAKMNDTVGPILEYKEEEDSASGGIKATFMNSIESPIRINSLIATIIKGSSNSNGEIRELNLPVQLNPGESLKFLIAPLGPLSGDGQTRASFDFFSLDVLPDKGMILDSIVDKSVPSKLKEITITTPMFKSDASKDLLEYIVEFNSGETVELTRDQPTVKTTLTQTPEELRNLVLGNLDQTKHAYYITEVRKDGHQTRGSERTLNGKNTIIVTGV